jgi:hypothetical protein
MDNYVSPYGFSPVTDAVIDTLVDKNDEPLIDAFERLTEEQRTDLEYAIENWWRESMSLARDHLSDILHDHLPRGTFDE